MNNKNRILRRALLVLVMLLAAALLLAACGGDDDDDGDSDSDQSAETPVVLDDSTLNEDVEDESDEGVLPAPVVETPAPPATQQMLPTLTPYLLPDEPVFQQAQEQASVALAAEMTLSLDDLDVLEPDTVLFLDVPLECPEVDDPDAEVNYVYVQHEQFIYAYQVVQPPMIEGALAPPDPIIQRCDDVFVDEDVLVIATDSPKLQPVDAVLADLEARGIDPAAGAVVSVDEALWNDEALGCPRGAGIEEPVSAALEGYRVIFRVDAMLYEYHTDLTGEMVVYCPPPPEFASVQAFLDLLLTMQDDLDVEIIPTEEEVATYIGLEAEGTLVEMTLSGDRIGVFGFSSSEDARTAAMQIEDPDVSRIFVSGPVLIVQEENNLMIYSTLSEHAEEVRNVLDEQAREAIEQAALEDEQEEDNTDE